jgi:hypothetical protein
MKNSEIVLHIKQAIDLLKGEPRPLQPGVSERSVAHRLAVHMEGFFEEWDVDCEYNRHGLNSKELAGIKACDEQKKTDRIYPDIIVHQRKDNQDQPKEGENLLVIELKLDDECDVCDKKKLELLTDLNGRFKYQLGLYINIGNNKYTKTWYKGGRRRAENDLLNIGV